MADDDIALQGALDAARGDGTVFVPAGRYRITTALRVRSGIRIHGDGGLSGIFFDPKGRKVEQTDCIEMLTIKDARDAEASSM